MSSSALAIATGALRGMLANRAHAEQRARVERAQRLGDLSTILQLTRSGVTFEDAGDGEPDRNTAVPSGGSIAPDSGQVRANDVFGLAAQHLGLAGEAAAEREADPLTRIPNFRASVRHAPASLTDVARRILTPDQAQRAAHARLYTADPDSFRMFIPNYDYEAHERTLASPKSDAAQRATGAAYTSPVMDALQDILDSTPIEVAGHKLHAVVDPSKSKAARNRHWFDQMVEAGYAPDGSTYEPDLDYKRQFTARQEEARKAGTKTERTQQEKDEAIAELVATKLFTPKEAHLLVEHHINTPAIERARAAAERAQAGSIRAEKRFEQRGTKATADERAQAEADAAKLATKFGTVDAALHQLEADGDDSIDEHDELVRTELLKLQAAQLRDSYLHPFGTSNLRR